MRTAAAVILCILALGVSRADAEFYQWVDRDGKEFFSNELEKVPPEYRAQARRVEPDEKRVSVGDKPATPAPAVRSTGPTEHRDRFGRGEKYWRDKAAKLRNKLRDQQHGLDLVIRDLDKLDKNAASHGPSKKKKRSSLEKKRDKIEKDIAKTRRMLEVDLPEEARRADAYPGWVRE